jgi:alanyl-tRNA synthetase
MNEQKERARKATKGKTGAANALGDNLDGFELKSENPTEFTGYDELSSTAEIVGLKSESGKSFVILDKSPFYVESGGQIDDQRKFDY